MSTETTSLLDVRSAVLTRRSIRKYKKDPIPEDTLREMLDLAQKAPSAWNLQPWRVVVVRDPATKEALKEASFGQAHVAEAPVVLVIYSDMRDTLENLDQVIHPGVHGERREAQKAGILKAFEGKSSEALEAWGAGQTYIYLGFLMLIVRAYGYDSVPMLGFDPGRVKAILDLPEHVAIPALLPIGLRDEEGFSHHRLPIDRVTRWH